MNIEVFNKADIEQLYRDMLKNMTDEQKDIFIKEYGSIKKGGWMRRRKNWQSEWERINYIR